MRFTLDEMLSLMRQDMQSWNGASNESDLTYKDGDSADPNLAEDWVSLTDCLNRGLLDIFSFTGYNVVNVTFACVVNQIEYTFDSQWSKVKSVRIADDQLRKTTIDSLDLRYEGWRGDTAALPEMYYILGATTIGLYKKPDSTYTVTLTVTKSPAKMSLAAGYPENLPDYMYPALLHRGIYYASKADGRNPAAMKRSEEALAEYNVEKEKLIKEFQIRDSYDENAPVDTIGKNEGQQ